MTNIKPCPFCGLTPNPSPEDEDFDDIPECLICVTCQCFDSGMSDTYVEKPTWNTRPIEDAQTALIVELEAKLEKAIAAHDDADPANYLHCACVAPLTARVAELEAELAALPAWTRIDPHDRTTWPPEHDAWVLNVVRYDDASHHLVATWGRVLNQADLIRFGQQWWLPIRLPWEEADNANQ